MSYGTGERLEDLALLIHRMHGEYRRGELKTRGRAFLDGLVNAYAIVGTDEPTDLDAALAQALGEAEHALAWLAEHGAGE